MGQLIRNTALGLLVGVTALAIGLQIAFPILFREGHESWSITEWFINYQGGFVRRGLPGEIIFTLWQFTGIRAQFITITLSMILFLTMIWMALRQNRGHWPWYVVLSPVMMTMLLFGGSLIRKDVLGICILAICLLLLRAGKRSLPATLAIALLVVAMILSHEAFLFYGVPLLLVAILIGNREAPEGMGPRALRMAFVLVAAFGTALLVSNFKGTADVAAAINASWLPEWRAIAGADCCFETPVAAINALQWSVDTGLSISPQVLDQYSFGIYVPLAWALSAVALFVLVVGTFHPSAPGQRSALMLLMVFNLLCIAPLFVLGWDFGRWLFYWVAGTFFLMCHLTETVETARFERIGFAWERRLSFSLQPAFLLVFGVPAAAWTVPNFIRSTPLGHMAAAALQLLETALGMDIKIFG